MPTTLEDVDETLTGHSHRRWPFWRRKPTLTEQVSQKAGDLAEQVGQTATDLTGQMTQTTGNLLQRLKGTSATRAERADIASLPLMADVPRGADVSAERAANAAEAASLAAQRTASAVERLGGWMALLASRAPLTPLAQTPREIVPEAALGPALERENARQSAGVTGNIKRAALTVGQRMSDLSDGRYGLEAQPPKAETKPGKKAQKRLEQQMRKEAKAEQFGSGVSWFPWMLGMSVGLVIGLVGVAYWQRRRLQDVWERTTHRMPRATEGVGQPLESSPTPSTILRPNLPTGTTRSTPLGSPASTDESNQQVNGRNESILH